MADDLLLSVTHKATALPLESPGAAAGMTTPAVPAGGRGKGELAADDGKSQSSNNPWAGRPFPLKHKWNVSSPTVFL
jgi:hypothetical protein